MDNFIVLRISRNFPLRAIERHNFRNAQEVAAFMWGRSMGTHLIYKNGQLAILAHLYADLSDLEDYLVGFESDKAGDQN